MILRRNWENLISSTTLLISFMLLSTWAGHSLILMLGIPKSRHLKNLTQKSEFFFTFWSFASLFLWLRSSTMCSSCRLSCTDEMSIYKNNLLPHNSLCVYWYIWSWHIWSLVWSGGSSGLLAWLMGLKQWRKIIDVLWTVIASRSFGVDGTDHFTSLS